MKDCLVFRAGTSGSTNRAERGPDGGPDGGPESKPPCLWSDMCWHIAVTHVLKHTLTMKSLTSMNVLNDAQWFSKQGLQPSTAFAPLQVRSTKRKEPTDEQVKKMARTDEVRADLVRRGAVGGQPRAALQDVLDKLPEEDIRHVDIVNASVHRLSDVLNVETDNAVIINRYGHVWSAGYSLKYRLFTLASFHGDIFYGRVVCEIMHEYLSREFAELQFSPASYTHVTPGNQFDYIAQRSRREAHSRMDVSVLKQMAQQRGIDVTDGDTKDVIVTKLFPPPPQPEPLQGERFVFQKLPNQARQIAPAHPQCKLYEHESNYYVQDIETGLVSFVRSETHKRWLREYLKV